MRNKLYHIIFAAIMVVLLLPVVQEIGKFKCWELHGYVQPPQPVKFEIGNLRNFSFQNYCGQLAKKNLGFKALFVRTYNQLLYTFFNETSNQNLILGKQGHYYLRQYTDDITGFTLEQKFGSIDSAQRMIQQNIPELLELIDSLQNHNTQLLIVLAPSKPNIYPEYLPDSIQKKISPFSFQKATGEAFRANGITTLDFVPLFKKMKEESIYPLYTYYGTHWAAGTIPFVCDTLLQKIGEVGHFKMPHIQYLDSNISKRYKLKSDYELERTANLLFRMKRERIPNPTFQLAETPQKKPRLLIIGDSYYTQIKGSCFEDAFSEVKFWQYNKYAYSSLSKDCEKVVMTDRYKSITEADVIVIIYTTMFAYDYLFGFPETALSVLKRGAHFDIESSIQSTIKAIKATPAWYESVKKQAKERHISIDEMLRENAIYTIENTQ